MKELHARQFDGSTFGMEIDAQTVAFRKFKKQITIEKAISQFGSERRVLTVPYLALAAIMGECHWLVSEKKLFDRVTIVGLYDGADIYVKYADEPIDFRTRQKPSI